MKTIMLLISLLLSEISLFSQIQWQWSYPYPQGNWLNDIHCFSSNEMIGVGKNGTVLRTTNAGANWIVSHRVNNLTDDFKRVFFINSQTGWIIGQNGSVLRTVDGGISWLNINLSVYLYSVYFINSNTGYIGAAGKLYKTTDGGSNWSEIALSTGFRTYDVLAIDESNIFVSGATQQVGMNPGHGEILRTTNGGTLWTNSQAPFTPAGGIYSSINFPNSVTGYAGGSRAATPYFIKTTDGGSTWVTLGTDTANSVSHLEFINGDSGWISATNGIYKTTNGGTNWAFQYAIENVGSPVSSAGYRLSANGNSAFASQYVDIIRTTNSGQNWTSLVKFFPRAVYDFEQIKFSGNTGIARSINDLLKTTDNGTTWKRMTTLPVNLNLGNIDVIDGSHYWAVVDASLFTTANGGDNWAVSNITGVTKCIKTQFLNLSSGFLLCKAGSYICSGFTTDGGQNWRIDTIVSAAVNSTGDIYFANMFTGYAFVEGSVYVTQNGGRDWAFKSSFSGSRLNYFFLNESVFFVAVTPTITEPAELYRTTDGGNSFTPMGIASYGQEYVNAVNFVSPLSGMLFLTKDAVNYETMCLTTTNGGASWVQSYTGAYFGIYDIYFKNANTAWVCGYNGTVLKTTNAGLLPEYSVSGTVRFQDNNQIVTSGYVKAIKHSTSGGEVVVLDSAAILPNGTFSLINIRRDTVDLMSFQDDEITSYNFVPTYYPSTVYWEEAEHIYVNSNLTGKDIYVYRLTGSPSGSRSISGGVYVNAMSSMAGLKDAIVYAKSGSNFRGYSISPSTGAYLIDSLPAGFYELICSRPGFGTLGRFEILGNGNLSGINFYYGGLLTIDETETPVSFYLSQNYPNPFNPVTKIRFGIPKKSFVSLTVFDITGREVCILLSGELNAGSYTFEYNAENLASGVYFYRISSGDYSETHKMILLK